MVTLNADWRARRHAWVVAAAVVGLLAALLVPSSPASAAAATGTLSGPVAGAPVGGAGSSLAAAGYVEEEYFLDGTATSYTSSVPLSQDGRWTTLAGAISPYKTRVLVRRPVDASKFNGSVVVEWLNVSAGADGSPEWSFMAPELVRSGYAWVGVSAQQVGIDGYPATGPLAILSGGGLKQRDANRYGSLQHPGDQFSYDIYSQAGQAVRAQAAKLLANLPVRTVLAAGESQSAFRLVTYVNAVHPLVKVYDGFFVHSRYGGAADLGPNLAAPMPTRIRDDVDVPVLIFETETDLLQYFPARQPDTDKIRLWELAGSAHADSYLLGASAGFDCGYRVNAGPQHYVLNAALRRFRSWVVDGTPPPVAPRLTVLAGSPPVIVRDGHGNALGGIRTAAVDAPTRQLSGEPRVGATSSPLAATFCRLFGSTVPFDHAKLSSLYRSQADIASASAVANANAVAAGHLLAADAGELDARVRDDVFELGGAPNVGSTAGVALAGPVRAIVSTPTGRGYLQLGGDGGVFTFGDAVFRGSAAGLRQSAPPVAIAADPRGRGYWVAGADGSVFSFGAPFHGSGYGKNLEGTVVGMAPTTSGDGYFLVTSRGQVVGFGDAVLPGSLSGVGLSAPVRGIAADPDGRGYWLVAEDGGVFAFDAPYLGNATGFRRFGDGSVGIAATSTGRGYLVAQRSGAVVAFGGAPAGAGADAIDNGRDTVGITSAGVKGYWLAVARTLG